MPFSAMRVRKFEGACYVYRVCLLAEDGTFYHTFLGVRKSSVLANSISLTSYVHCSSMTTLIVEFQLNCYGKSRDGWITITSPVL